MSKGKEIQTAEKGRRVAAEQLVKQRSAQMIWSKGVFSFFVS